MLNFTVRFHGVCYVVGHSCFFLVFVVGHLWATIRGISFPVTSFILLFGILRVGGVSKCPWEFWPAPKKSPTLPPVPPYKALR
jgi:hypothetical protein